MTYRVVQHSFGSLGSGGPIGALTRLLDSGLGPDFELAHVQQGRPAGGVNLALVREMASEMRKFNPDLAHIRGLGNEGFHGVLAARVARVPKILVSVHGSVSDLVHGGSTVRNQVVARVLEPLTLAMATHVITVCESALQHRQLIPVSRKVLGSVPNGVLVQEQPAALRQSVRRGLGVEDHEIVVVTVSRLSLEKGLVDLFESLALLEPHTLSRMRVVVVGDGPDRLHIEAAAEKHRAVGARVVFLGHRADATELLAGADIFVLPSLHENMSNALLEAMSVGLPVIATSVGGSREVVELGGGILIPASSPHALAESLSLLAGDGGLRLSMGKAARHTIRENYTVEHMKKSLEATYRTILKG